MIVFFILFVTLRGISSWVYISEYLVSSVKKPLGCEWFPSWSLSSNLDRSGGEQVIPTFTLCISSCVLPFVLPSFLLHICITSIAILYLLRRAWLNWPSMNSVKLFFYSWPCSRYTIKKRKKIRKGESTILTVLTDWPERSPGHYLLVTARIKQFRLCSIVAAAFVEIILTKLRGSRLNNLL